MYINNDMYIYMYIYICTYIYIFQYAQCIAVFACNQTLMFLLVVSFMLPSNAQNGNAQIAQNKSSIQGTSTNIHGQSHGQ